jgi:hypothetical protein
MDGWVAGKAGLRIAYSNKKSDKSEEKNATKTISGP